MLGGGQSPIVDPKTDADKRAAFYAAQKSTELLKDDVDEIKSDYVSAESEFGTTGRVVVSDGTSRKVKASTVDISSISTSLANGVTTESAFPAAGRIIVSAGADRTVEASEAILADFATALQVSSLTSRVSVNEGSISDIQGDYVSAESVFGTDGLVLVADGADRGAKASAIPSSSLVVDSDITDMVTASATFDTDNALLRADGTGRGAQKSSASVSDTGVLSTSISENMASGAVVVTTVTDDQGNVCHEERCSRRADFNSCYGLGAGTALQSGGAFNCLFGTSAGLSITTGINNMCIGLSSGRSLTTQSNCVFVGVTAGRDATAGNNVGIGRNAARGIITGDGNTFIGDRAGEVGQSPSASNSMGLGQGAVTTASNQVVLGNTSVTQCVINGGAIVNEQGLDADTRIEGDTLTHMFFCDASAATENIALVANTAPNWQSMDRGVFLGDASTVPTGNPTGGVFLFSEFGKLQVRDPNGLVTQISGRMQLAVFNDSTRGASGVAGRIIFNTDDANINIDDGTNWILPDGTVT